VTLCQNAITLRIWKIEESKVAIITNNATE